ncbi:MAG: iron-containing alcohol dehydrogenase [Euryarchaeota archaeon]|nr:iron-containing alcohol dehydrogenase [Euryarchaeota archaeon]MDE2043636.1 iron-containing alcohol dehydrogenase [Thermoplasmata archaeon]
MWFFTAPKIVFGAGAIEFLASLPTKKAMIVCDRFLAEQGTYKPVQEQLEKAGASVKVFGEVEPEPHITTVSSGLKIARAFEPDTIVGLGGGSAMDMAKAIYALYERPDLTIYDLTPIVDLNLGKKARLIQVPTTSGTGAETTWATIITEGEGGRKLELAHRDLIAQWAVLDPMFPSSMPPKLTADTGADALAHSIESISSQWSNPFSDAMGMKAVDTIFRYLPKAVKGQPVPSEVREELHLAAAMAGLSFGNAQIGIGHALGHAFGSVFKVPHGRTVGLFLPYHIEFNFAAARDKFARLSPVLGDSTVRNARDLSAKVRSLWDQIGMSKTIPEATKVTEKEFEEKLPELVERADSSTGLVANARVPTSQELERILRAAWSGAPVDF